MNTEKDLIRVLTKILKLPEKKQMLVAGFVEGVQYEEFEKSPEEQDKLRPEMVATAN